MILLKPLPSDPASQNVTGSLPTIRFGSVMMRMASSRSRGLSALNRFRAWVEDLGCRVQRWELVWGSLGRGHRHKKWAITRQAKLHIGIYRECMYAAEFSHGRWVGGGLRLAIGLMRIAGK